ncbi:5'-deoxyadenosine deaminase [Paramyrothecium foliicola]|nr:5'-deoxyadenosine deaminase [Paramyrothecium foliicola]
MRLRFLAPVLLGTGVLAGSTLFEHATIITFDEETQTPIALRDASLLITDDRIAAISGPGGSNLRIPSGTERIDATNDIISPGFVDTHRHVWQTALRTVGASTSLIMYIIHWTSAVSQIWDPEIMYYSELQGLCEALDAGVTTIVDNATGGFSRQIVDASIQAAVDSGIRNFFVYPISRGREGFDFESQIDHFRSIGGSERLARTRVSMGLGYETFDTGSEEDVQTIIDLARESNISLLETHSVGGAMGTDNSPTRLAELGILNETFPIIFVHGTGTTPTDAAHLRTANHYISMAPEFEMHHGQNSFQAALAHDQASLSVGTHYSMSGDLVSQARIWLQSVRNLILSRTLNDFKVPTNNPMSTNQAFLLATRSGGQALRRPDLGVIQVGAKADIAVFDGSAPGLLGSKDPIAAIILHSHVGNVKHVLVDGRWKKKDGQLRCASNEADARAKFLQSAQKVQQFLDDTPLPVLQGQNPATNASYEAVDEVDVVRGHFTGY